MRNPHLVITASWMFAASWMIAGSLMVLLSCFACGNRVHRKGVAIARATRENARATQERSADDESDGAENVAPPRPQQNRQQAQRPRPAQRPPARRNHTPGVQEDTPGVQEDTPGVQEDTPGVQEDTPGVQEDTPGVQEDTPGEDTRAIEKAVRDYLPQFVATYHATGGVPAALSHVKIKASRSSPTQAVAMMDYDAGARHGQALFEMRKRDGGWHVENVDR